MTSPISEPAFVPQTANLWDRDPLMQLRKHTPRFNLADVLRDVRQAHPLPSEVAEHITREDTEDFLDQLAVLSPEELYDFTDRIPPRDMILIFACFTVPLYPEEINLLESIIRRRAGWYTYRIAWDYLQMHFPNASLQRCLLTIYKELIGQPWRFPRPFDLEDILLDHFKIEANDPHLIRACLRYLSMEMDRNPDFSFREFLNRFAIKAYSPFGVAFLGDFFSLAPSSWMVKEEELFTGVVARMHPGEAAKHLRRSLEAESDPAAKQRLRRRFSELFIRDQADAKIWDYVSPELCESFHAWYYSDVIRRHTSTSMGKRRCYMEVLDEVKDLDVPAPNLLALRFRNFVIVDDKNRPDRAYYYEDQTTVQLLKQGLDVVALADPPLAGRSCADALSSGRKEGIVELRFSKKERPDTKSFLDFVLGYANRPRSAEQTSKMKNWFD